MGRRARSTSVVSEDDLARVSICTELEPGQTLRVVKFLAYGWSSAALDAGACAIRSTPRSRRPKRTGWDGLLTVSGSTSATVWERADIEIDGDPELQQAVRFALFQVAQSAARAEQRAIPAKGLTGRGYDGHSFWDMESYRPAGAHLHAAHAARDALWWRHSTLDLARDRAHELRLRGAAFPWRTIRGEECSGYWPAGTAAFHVNADIADAARRYIVATGDVEFERGPGGGAARRDGAAVALARSP